MSEAAGQLEAETQGPIQPDVCPPDEREGNLERLKGERADARQHHRSDVSVNGVVEP